MQRNKYEVAFVTVAIFWAACAVYFEVSLHLKHLPAFGMSVPSAGPGCQPRNYQHHLDVQQEAAQVRELAQRVVARIDEMEDSEEARRLAARLLSTLRRLQTINVIGEADRQPCATPYVNSAEAVLERVMYERVRYFNPGVRVFYNRQHKLTAVVFHNAVGDRSVSWHFGWGANRLHVQLEGTGRSVLIAEDATFELRD